MLVASHRAQKYLERAEINAAQLRIEALMSYITLYLTLQYAILPQLIHENPLWNKKQIAAEKYPYFYELLSNKDRDDMDIKEYGPKSKFSVNIGFGKIYWSLLQELGVAALLMLAVGDAGLTVIARAMGTENQNRSSLVLSLSRSRGWWSFAHAIGPATLSTFFGPCERQYTVEQLLHQLRTEPLPTASILLINQCCQKEEIVMGDEPAREEVPMRWELEVGGGTIPIKHLPNTSQPKAPRGREDVWTWVNYSPGAKIAFEFLLPPGKGGHDEPINYFCDFYNRRAIPGRRAVRIGSLRELHAGRTAQGTQQRLDILANEEQSNCELLVFPAPVEDAVIGVILYPQTTTATIYNWTAQRHLAVKVGEVGRVVEKYISINATGTYS
jgi:hypothetical protein